jgi:hypothetical protein
MNFFEAMKEIDEGKMVYCGTLIYKKDEDGTLVRNYENLMSDPDEWSKVDEFISQDISGDWKLYEEPKEEKGLWEKGGILLALKSGLDNRRWAQTDLATFNNAGIYANWRNALYTFMDLKGHPLAVKANHDINEQYFISIHICRDHFGIYTDQSTFLCNKGDILSPMFSTEEDAKKAIEDIGEENLIKMAKVFQGIYE